MKWHLLPSSATSAYDPVVLAPVIPAAPARNPGALDLPPMLLASHVMAMELVVLPPPRMQTSWWCCLCMNQCTLQLLLDTQAYR